MIKANLKDQDGWVLAYNLTKDDRDRNGSDFICPVCNEQVMLKYGEVKYPHFAHYKDSDCTHGQGESKEHADLKTLIYEFLKKEYGHMHDVDMEEIIGNRKRVADILFSDIAIEVQLSNVTIENIKDRMEDYRQYDIHVLWLFDEKYRNKAVTKWLDDNKYYYKFVNDIKFEGDNFYGDIFNAKEMSEYRTIVIRDFPIDIAIYINEFTTKYKDRNIKLKGSMNKFITEERKFKVKREYYIKEKALIKAEKEKRERDLFNSTQAKNDSKKALKICEDYNQMKKQAMDDLIKEQERKSQTQIHNEKIKFFERRKAEETKERIRLDEAKRKSQLAKEAKERFLNSIKENKHKILEKIDHYKETDIQLWLDMNYYIDPENSFLYSSDTESKRIALKKVRGVINECIK